MPNPFTLLFTLKQHTPIIHFQHEQAGATLRASELKPKLDRFIFIKLGNGNYEVGISYAKRNKWLIGTNGKAALNYKFNVDVDAAKVENCFIEKYFPSFLGNMGNSSHNEKKFSFTNSGIVCVIFSLHIDLLKSIKTYIADFFSLHNVGTRQSKGFGSFSVIEIDKNMVQFPKNNFRYFFNIKSDQSGWAAQSRDLFRKIDWFYRSLRSGINMKGRNKKSILYFKSCLFMYLNSQQPKIQWDKKTIKAHLFNDIDEDNVEYMQTQNNKHGHPDILNNPEKQNLDLRLKDYRDLFGLSSKESWYYYKEDSISKTQAKYVNNTWIPIKDGSESVQRYKSPILFKPVMGRDGMYTVYFDVFINDTEYDHFKKQKMAVMSSNENLLILPVAEDFDFCKYFKYAFQNIDPKTHTKVYDHNEAQEIVNSLTGIFSQLKKQVKNG